MASNRCKKYIVETILPLSILLICLFQHYCQYSAMVTPRTKKLDEQDKRNAIFNFNIGKRQFDFHLPKIEEYFNDSPLINIYFIKNSILKLFDKINPEKDNELNIVKYKLFYLLAHDFIFIVIIYIFIYHGFKAGIIKLIFQILRLYFNTRRLKKANRNIYLYQAVKNYFETQKLKNIDFFSSEGFQYLEYLSNCVIILDIIWLFVLYKQRKNKKERIIITDDDRVDYQIKERQDQGDSSKRNQEDSDDNDNDNDYIIRENNDNKDDDDSDNNNINNKEDNNNNENMYTNDDYNADNEEENNNEIIINNKNDIEENNLNEKNDNNDENNEQEEEEEENNQETK